MRVSIGQDAAALSKEAALRVQTDFETSLVDMRARVAHAGLHAIQVICSIDSALVSLTLGKLAREPPT